MKTEITDLSRFIDCPIRNKRVQETPEERVRQTLIGKMTREWGFPKGLVSVERAVSSRRYDLLCYSPRMTPLILIECKAEDFDERAIDQAAGYNEILKAPFICVTNGVRTITFWYEKGGVASVPFLPLFKELYAISERL